MGSYLRKDGLQHVLWAIVGAPLPSPLGACRPRPLLSGFYFILMFAGALPPSLRFVFFFFAEALPPGHRWGLAAPKPPLRFVCYLRERCPQTPAI